MLALLKTFSEGIMLLMITGQLIFVVILTILAVMVGRSLGFWETLPVITAMTWFLTSGCSLLFAIGQIGDDRGLFREKIRTVLVPSGLVVALFNIAIFPFWLEVLLFPILVILVFISIVCSSQPSAGIAKLCRLVYVIALMFVAVKGLVEYPETWKSLIQGILFPIWLTLGSLPYLSLLIAAERYRFKSGSKCKIVSAADYGSDWPLTVDSANLCCRHSAVWVEVDGKIYGINGTAKGMLRQNGIKCFDLEEIWRDNPKFYGMKVSIHRLLQDGFALEQDE